MDPATAQNEPIYALLVVVCLLAIVWWARRRRRRLRLRQKHRVALEALQQSRVPPPEPAPQARAAAAPTLAPETPHAIAQKAPGVSLAYRGLERSRAQLTGRLEALFAGGKRRIDEQTLTACEEVLLTSDVGVAQSDKLLAALREAGDAAGEPLSAAEVRVLLRAELREALEHVAEPTPAYALAHPSAPGEPKVWMFVGVNGVGKTTTIGKLAAALGGAGKKVVVGAGDTYRAAAAEQLGVWAERSGARLVRGDAGADPASVAFNALAAGKKDTADVVLLDTAGRLHTQTDLMQELAKVRRALGKQVVGAPHHTWLVVDATTGQNALHQAKAFHEAMELTGIVLTKLDGSAKGGIVVAIAQAIGVPVRFVGLGEQADDLQPFDAGAFLDALV